MLSDSDLSARQWYQPSPRCQARIAKRQIQTVLNETIEVFLASSSRMESEARSSAIGGRTFCISVRAGRRDQLFLRLRTTTMAADMEVPTRARRPASISGVAGAGSGSPA